MKIEFPHDCKICGKELKGTFGSHLPRSHNITSKIYYDTFYKEDGEGICLTCGKETKFIRYQEGYHKFCSMSCNNRNPNLKKERGRKSSKTKREKYNSLINNDGNNANSYYLYIIRDPIKHIIKIGRSSDYQKRIDRINKNIGNETRILHVLKGPYYKIKQLENNIHKRFDEHCKVQPKGINGRTEWFNEIIIKDLSDSIRFIRRYLGRIVTYEI